MMVKILTGKIGQAAVCLLMLVLNACAFASVDRPDLTKYNATIVHQRTIGLSRGEALEAAKAAAQSLGFKISFFNQNMGELRSDPMSVPSAGHCDCGTWNGSQVEGSANAILKARAREVGAKQTNLWVQVLYVTNFTANNLYGMTTRRETYQCASLGTAELGFWEAIDRYLASVRGVPPGKDK